VPVSQHGWEQASIGGVVVDPENGQAAEIVRIGVDEWRRGIRFGECRGEMEGAAHSFFCRSGGMPTPVSRTEKFSTTSGDEVSAALVTCRIASANRAAAQLPPRSASFSGRERPNRHETLAASNEPIAAALVCAHMVKFLLWCVLLLLCWPLALFALIAYPIVWLLLIPFRIVGIAVDGVLGLLRAIVMLPVRVIGGSRAL
jgi:hypothetical protein